MNFIKKLWNAITGFFKNNENTIKMAVDLATAILLDKHPELKKVIIKTTDDVNRAIDTKIIVSSDTVRAFVIEALKANGVGPLTQVEALILVDAIMSAIVQEIGTDKIDVTPVDIQLDIVKKVMTWVNQIAQLAPDKVAAIAKGGK